jgi:hypothetical protein
VDRAMVEGCNDDFVFICYPSVTYVDQSVRRTGQQDVGIGRVKV